MDRYITLMLVPDREKGVVSLRLPRIVFQALVFFGVAFTILLGILSYDYWKILRQVYENKYLSIENRQLKEQIQLFQMKLNALTEDIERINTFEKKLRIITGHEITDMKQGIVPVDPQENSGSAPQMERERDGEVGAKTTSTTSTPLGEGLPSFENIEKEVDYQELKNLYEQKIATSLGLQAGYAYTKEWSRLTQSSFALAGQYASFDYRYGKINSFVEKMEIDIHNLDQFLLDKESFLRSTPTLLPAKGWITSYYGPRMSDFSGRIKMHEGLDVGADPGTPIIAPADGVVTFAGTKPGFGNFVQIDHGYGVETIYAHAKTVSAQKGQRVKRGDLLATVGNTGNSTGPHLHYEIRVNGTPVDPLYYILD